jgi:hypothetical protein
MLDRSPDDPDKEAAAPRPKRIWPLRGAMRAGGKLKAGRKPHRMTVGGASVPDIELVERLGEIGATVDELSLVFGLSQVTVSARFKANPKLRDAYERGKALARISMRHRLFQASEKPTDGGTRAILFLARQLLLWPRDAGDSSIIEPPPPEDARLQRLSLEERETLDRLMAKATR